MSAWVNSLRSRGAKVVAHCSDLRGRVGGYGESLASALNLIADKRSFASDACLEDDYDWDVDLDVEYSLENGQSFMPNLWDVEPRPHLHNIAPMLPPKPTIHPDALNPIHSPPHNKKTKPKTKAKKQQQNASSAEYNKLTDFLVNFGMPPQKCKTVVKMCKARRILSNEHQLILRIQELQEKWEWEDLTVLNLIQKDTRLLVLTADCIVNKIRFLLGHYGEKTGLEFIARHPQVLQRDVKSLVTDIELMQKYIREVFGMEPPALASGLGQPLYCRKFETVKEKLERALGFLPMWVVKRFLASPGKTKWLVLSSERLESNFLSFVSDALPPMFGATAGKVGQMLVAREPDLLITNPDKLKERTDALCNEWMLEFAGDIIMAHPHLLLCPHEFVIAKWTSLLTWASSNPYWQLCVNDYKAETLGMCIKSSMKVMSRLHFLATFPDWLHKTPLVILSTSAKKFNAHFPKFEQWYELMYNGVGGSSIEKGFEREFLELVKDWRSSKLQGLKLGRGVVLNVDENRQELVNGSNSSNASGNSYSNYAKRFRHSNGESSDAGVNDMGAVLNGLEPPEDLAAKVQALSTAKDEEGESGKVDAWFRVFEFCKFDKQETSEFLVAKPFLMQADPDEAFSIAQYLVTELGLCRAQVGLVVGKCPTLLTQNLSDLEANVKCLMQEGGFSKDQVSIIMRELPSRFKGVGFETMMEKLKFLKQEVDVDACDLAARPRVLEFSLEKRLKPRIRFLRNKGVRVDRRMWRAALFSTDASFSINLADCKLEDFQKYMASTTP